MKRILALLVILAMLLTTLASCDWFNTQDPECPPHIDEDGDLKCDICGENCAEIPPECGQQKDEDGDGKCDICGADIREPQPPACEEHKDEDGDYKCDSCGHVMFEEIKYTLNVSDIEAGVRSENDINGKFTIASGTEVRNRTKTYEGVEYNKSIKIGGNAHKIMIDVPGTGTLRFIIQNGSSGVDMQYTKVIDPNGIAQDIEFVAGAESNPLVMIEVEVSEGQWTITRGKNGGTQDIFYLELECVVATSEENGFELVSEGKTEFLVGEALDTTSVRLNATYANGKTDNLPLENVQIDTSLVNMGQSGTYPVTVKYKEYDPITYHVSVFAPESIELGFDAIEKLANNSAAGNGVYYNHSFKEFYFLGEELDKRGLSVIVIAKCGDMELKFKVDDYTIEGFNSAEEGEQTLTISANGVSATTIVHVANVEITPDEDGIVKALVDPAYLGIRGHLSGPYHVFSTIQQALDFLAHVDAATLKQLTLAPGQYNEKLEITIPNLTIEGVGEKPEDVVIEWDSLYGLVDAGGFTHTTDSTATVAIRDSAVNVEIRNVTISNYWNTQERMDKASLAIERGLALLVQSDRFIMKDSRLLGIQDTLELFTGRQYFENTFISGYTDFVFGTNNTTYFKNCTIHVIDTVKDDQGTAGYITAFKGSNKGESDAITYGAIFDGCKFTADEGVTEGCTAIGRPWGAYAAVAVMNSELGGHISVKGFTGAKNERYVSMNAKPTDATVQYVEYNNTGAGAIAEAVAGMRMLTAEEAALYADFTVIFGKTNRNVSYLDLWDPMSEEVQVDDRTYYFFNGQTGTTGTYYTYDQNLQGTTGTFGEIAIDATAGKVTARDADTQMNAGAKLTFNVKGGTTVTVISYPGYGFYTLNGVAHNANEMFSQYYAEDTEVEMLVTATTYLYQIIIDPNSEAPAAAELNEIKASGMNVNYVVGDEISLEGLVVNAIYSDNSVHTVNDYSVDTSALNKNAEGTYEIVISYGGKTAIIKVTYEDPNAGPEISKDTYLDFSTPDGLAEVQNNPKVTMTGSIRHNGGEIQITGTISFKVKAGTVVTVLPYANTQYASYTIGKEGEEGLETYSESMSMMFDEDCTVVYTGLSNNYLVAIVIECPIGEGKYVFGGSSEEGDVTGILETIPGMSISGTCKTHSGGAQLGSDSQIIFIAPALATVTVQGYDKTYGQLLVLVDGVPVEMNDKAQYVFTTDYACTIIIEAVNVGTEEAPAYNKSYITYIDVEYPYVYAEATTIDLSATGANIQKVVGEYEGLKVDATNGKFADNNGGWTQVNTGTIITLNVADGAQVSVTAYSSADNFTVEIVNGVCTITCVGNDYLKAITISFE